MKMRPASQNPIAILSFLSHIPRAFFAPGRRSRAAWLLGLLALGLGLFAPSRGLAFVMDPLGHGIIAVTTTIEADSPEAAKQMASLEAVRACAGRVFWGQDLMIALPLLDAYLDKSCGRFVKAVETIQSAFVAGKAKMTLRVFVRSEDLIKDLRDKRFTFAPLARPYFKVFLAEKLENEYAAYSIGREALTANFQDRNLRPYEGAIENPPNNADVAADPILLKDALVACERRGVEVLISGESATIRNSTKELYYDTFYFYTTVIKATLIRVDTGEILGTASAKGSASNTDQQAAIDASIRRTTSLVTAELANSFDKVWGPTILDRNNYRLLLTGVTPKTLKLVQDALAGAHASAKVFLRQSYDRTATLSMIFPGEREELLKMIATNPYPTLRIIPPKEISGRIEATITLSSIEKRRSVRYSGDDQLPSILTYRYAAEANFKIVDVKTGETVNEAACRQEFASTDEDEAAQSAWRASVGDALASLVKTFPRNIHGVTLVDASYQTVFLTHKEEILKEISGESAERKQKIAGELAQNSPEQEKTIRNARLADRMDKEFSHMAEQVPENLRTRKMILARNFGKILQKDSPLAKVSVSSSNEGPQFWVKFTQDADKQNNLLGADSLLPDASLTASASSHWLEVQVGE